MPRFLPEALTATLATDRTDGFVPFTLAQRARCAAAILARAAALMPDFFFGASAAEVEEEPRMEASSFSNALILSLTSAARFNCDEVSDSRLLMIVLV